MVPKPTLGCASDECDQICARALAMRAKRHMPKRQRLSPEVAAAVQDILQGTATDSAGEWLQREYVRLMQRELRMRKQLLESNSASAPIGASAVGNGDPPASGAAQQHGGAVDNAGVDGNA